MRVHVHKLHREVAVLLDLRDGEHDRLGPEVDDRARVRRVAVDRLDRLLAGLLDVLLVAERVDRPAYIPSVVSTARA